MRYETRSIGTTIIQGPVHDMPVPFDPGMHNADRAQIAALGADFVPAVRRSPLEHERDAGVVLDPLEGPGPMTDTRNHRRHGNAFRAGGREFGREMLDDLMALTPPEAHANLRAIYDARAKLPKWSKQAPTDREVSE